MTASAREPVIELDGIVSEQPSEVDPFAALSGGNQLKEVRVRDVVHALEVAADDKRITSVVLDLNHAPRFDLVHRLGFTEEQADRMIRTRRVIPYLEEVEARLPSIDAERLWSRIGKPYKRFRA